MPEIEKDTIYYDGIKKLEEKIKEIYKENPYCKVVVFIDDLDRCSPETAVEVFESIKIFLDIEGFVFIVGLSKKMLEKMISVKLEKAGLKDVEAQEYLRKIIQLEINIPAWNNDSISVLLKKYQIKLDEDHINVISDNEDLILKAVKKNPRRTKRFINNFIIASSTKDINARTYFLREVVADIWEKVYDNLRDNNEFRQKIKGYIDLSREERVTSFKNIREEKQKDKDNLSKVDEDILCVDNKFWDFIDGEKNKQPFKEMIDQWEKYDSVGESVKETDILSISLDRESALYLLLSGKIEEFNKKRQIHEPLDLNESDLSDANLSSANLLRANLLRANLSSANLLRANLLRANLSRANLSRANLSRANLSRANLSHADLSHAYLPYANLSEANLPVSNLSSAYLSHADLSHADLPVSNLSRAYLSHANLSHADLSGAEILHANLSSANLSSANLSRSYLLGANLSGADLSGANLLRANLSGADFSGADFSGANLENSIILNKNDSNTKGLIINEKTSFKDAITDSKEILSYLENIIPQEKMPILFNNKEKLIEELQKKEHDRIEIEHMLTWSKL